METENVSFQIEDVACGWLKAAVGGAQETVFPQNSCLHGGEVPCSFLRSISELLEGRKVAWSCWDGESTAYIWRLEREDELVEIRIYETQWLPPRGEEAQLRRVVEDAVPALQGRTSLWLFARSVWEAFESWDCGGEGTPRKTAGFDAGALRGERSRLRRLLRRNGYG